MLFSLAGCMQLLPAAAYVLAYELLFGQGFRSKGPAERAVLAQQVRKIPALSVMASAFNTSAASCCHVFQVFVAFALFNTTYVQTHAAVACCVCNQHANTAY
jgi:hypothetical protein